MPIESALRDADVVAICQQCSPDAVDAIVVIRPWPSGGGFDLYVLAGLSSACPHFAALAAAIDTFWLAFCAQYFGEEAPYPIQLASEAGEWSLATHGWLKAQGSEWGEADG